MRWTESGIDPTQWNEQQKIDYVKEMIAGIGYNYEQLREWFEQFGGILSPAHLFSDLILSFEKYSPIRNIKISKILLLVG